MLLAWSLTVLLAVLEYYDAKMVFFSSMTSSPYTGKELTYARCVIISLHYEVYARICILVEGVPSVKCGFLYG